MDAAENVVNVRAYKNDGSKRSQNILFTEDHLTYVEGEGETTTIRLYASTRWKGSNLKKDS
jgi:hypothetical protein